MLIFFTHIRIISTHTLVFSGNSSDIYFGEKDKSEKDYRNARFCVCLCGVCSDRKEISHQCSVNYFNSAANLLVYGPFYYFLNYISVLGKSILGNLAIILYCRNIFYNQGEE